MGKVWPDRMEAKLPEGSFERIAKVLNGQKRTAFVREAIEKELQRREADLPNEE